MLDVNWGVRKAVAKSKVEHNDETVKCGDDNGADLGNVHNRIYFYIDVNRGSILDLNKKIRELGSDLLVQQTKLGLDEPPPIYLHIHSYGGSVYAGLAGMAEIINAPVPVITIVDGGAASAATFLSVVGHKRLINRDAQILIHQVSAGIWGTYEEIKDNAKNLDLLMKTVRSIYTQHTKIPEKKLIEMLKKDLWWDAKTCLRYGLVDEII